MFRLFHTHLPSAPSLLAFRLAILLSTSATAFAGVELNWTDNSENEEGFHIERSSDGIIFRWIGSVPANTTRYFDLEAPGGATYSYRVCAFNLFGRSGYTDPLQVEILPKLSFADWALEQEVSVLTSLSRATGGTSPESSDNRLLLYYAYGIDPQHPDLAPYPQISLAKSEGRPRIRIRHGLFERADGIRARLLASEDLQSWNPLDVSPKIDTIDQLRRWESFELPAPRRPQFYRIEITLDPTAILADSQ